MWMDMMPVAHHIVLLWLLLQHCSFGRFISISMLGLTALRNLPLMQQQQQHCMMMIEKRALPS